MRIRLLPLLVLLVLASPRARAEGRPSLRDLWRQFETAPSLADQRRILEQLDAWPEKERAQTLGRWLRKASGEPESVALLARTMLEASPGAAARRIRSLLKDGDLAPARAALLRVLVDGPAGPALSHRAFGNERIRNPAAFLLAARLTDAPEELEATRAARALNALDDVRRLLADPPAEGSWGRVGAHLMSLLPLAPALQAELAKRVLQSLPPATPKDLEGWPEPYLLELWRQGEVAALSPLLVSEHASRDLSILGEVRKTRDPRAIAPLVEALARVPAHSGMFYRILGLLQDLTGSRVPADPEQWRSWVAGHRPWLDTVQVLPETENPEATVNLGIAFLLERQQTDGSFQYGETGRRNHSHHRVGTTALCLYALRMAGVPKDAPPLERAAAFLLLRERENSQPPVFGYNYGAGIAAMALEVLDRKRYKNDLQQLTLRLVEGQQGSGGWSYHLPYGTQASRDGGIDLSNTQYSVLGLRSAAFARLPIRRDVWEGVLHLMRGAEIGTSGEWRYTVPGESLRSGMAAIAAACLLIARSQLEKGLKLEEVLADEQMVRALRSMARKYGKATLYDRMDHYTLYSIERVGALFGVYSFDGVPWYEEGSRILLERQLLDGGWGVADERVKWWQTWGRNVDTAYALLFLKRATTPVFSAGLDVPSDPDRPIRRVEPRRVQPPGGAPYRIDADAPPRRADLPSAAKRIGDLRHSCRRLLYERLQSTGSAVSRLLLWRALAAVDLLDARAHVMAGETLGAKGSWRTDAALDAALPAGAPSRRACREVQGILERTALRAMAQVTAEGVGERGARDLVQFALELKRAARDVMQ